MPLRLSRERKSARILVDNNQGVGKVHGSLLRMSKVEKATWALVKGVKGGEKYREPC